ncbi:MAG: hypothetical protein R2712_16595 [Vicinamibacterales bacterium]
MRAVEQAVTGQPANDETAAMAGELAVEGAVPLRYNAYRSRSCATCTPRDPGGPIPSSTT